jgi:hypothetical protein
MTRPGDTSDGSDDADLTPDADETVSVETADETAEAGDDGDDGDTENDSGAETFSRVYVERLRRESAGYRERAQRADELAGRLHTALVEATGRLADASDLPFDEAHLDDPTALAGAIDELLERKPHLASRRPAGDIGQGHRGGSAEPVNLANLLRARA